MSDLDSDERGGARVSRLARYAALPLAPGRAEAAAAVLDAWWPAANELSAKMSAAQHQMLAPVTVLTHPADAAEE